MLPSDCHVGVKRTVPASAQTRSKHNRSIGPKLATIDRLSATVSLSPNQRRVFQALLYEVVATALVTPLLWWLFGRSLVSTLALTVALSAIALAFNFGFNALLIPGSGAKPMASGPGSGARRTALVLRWVWAWS